MAINRTYENERLLLRGSHYPLQFKWVCNRYTKLRQIRAREEEQAANLSRYLRFVESCGGDRATARAESSPKEQNT
jgi:hypothetical protein